MAPGQIIMKVFEEDLSEKIKNWSQDFLYVSEMSLRLWSQLNLLLYGQCEIGSKEKSKAKLLNGFTGKLVCFASLEMLKLLVGLKRSQFWTECSTWMHFQQFPSVILRSIPDYDRLNTGVPRWKLQPKTLFVYPNTHSPFWFPLFFIYLLHALSLEIHGFCICYRVTWQMIMCLKPKKFPFILSIK